MGKATVVYVYHGILLSIKGGVQAFAETWMNLEDMMLSETEKIDTV